MNSEFLESRLMYERTTRGIRVSIEPTYLEGQSEPDDDHFVWAYRVRIDNRSEATICVRTRRWRITDARGGTEEVAGEGVVGEQPVIKPGEIFEYTSGAPLSTPSGLMMGQCGIEGPNGELFDVDIPAFSLDSPYETSRVH